MAKDLGAAKVLRLLRLLDIDVMLMDAPPRTSTDYVRLAAAAGSTGFREALGEEELLHAVLSGKPPPRKRPHLRRMLEDSSPQLVNGLVSQIAEWSEPAKVRSNLAALAKSLDVQWRPEWINPG